MYKIHSILHPTDFSPHSQYAFGIARDLARQNKAELIVLHVAPPPGPEQVSFGEVATQREPDSYFRRLLAQMHRLYGPSAKDAAAHYIVTEGDPVREIDRVAREAGCDLIVVGTHGYGGVQRLLLGSTAERLVRSAPCPVLTVKLPDADGSESAGDGKKKEFTR